MEYYFAFVLRKENISSPFTKFYCCDEIAVFKEDRSADVRVNNGFDAQNKVFLNLKE